jgi:uncharacterized protein (DUF924 family)
MQPAEVLNFWFGDLRPAQWFRPSPDVDRLIGDRFGDIHRAALACELAAWRVTAEGRLAEIIVLDQFSRQIHRGSAKAYQGDPLALGLAQTAVQLGRDLELPAVRRAFLYMPYMHSESGLIHQDALRLFGAPGLETSLVSERRHKAIIDRFGRFPHRNPALGRESTPEETVFLQGPGSKF